MATRKRAPAAPPWMEEPGRAARIGKTALMILLASVVLLPFASIIAVSLSS